MIKKCGLFAVILLIVFPAISAGYQERLIQSMGDGKCTLYIEANDEERILTLRLNPLAPECYATKDAMQKLLTEVFSKTDPSKLEGSYATLALGRLNNYPWLCEYLATSAYKDPRWNKKKGKPVSMDLYKYVSSILSRREVLSQFEDTFGNSGYRIKALTLEKVCVGRFSDLPLYEGKILPGKVPVDVVVWLRLEKK